jgi:cation transport regulator ChaC
VRRVAAEFPWRLGARTLAIVRDKRVRHPLEERLGQTERPELLEFLNLLAYGHHLDRARPIFEDGKVRLDGKQGGLARLLCQGVRANRGVERVPGRRGKLAEGVQAEVLFALSYGGAQQATQALRRRGLDLETA